MINKLTKKMKKKILKKKKKIKRKINLDQNLEIKSIVAKSLEVEENHVPEIDLVQEGIYHI